MFNNKRTKKALVIKKKMQKTVIVIFERLVKHSVYGKYIKRTTKLHVHDEYDESNFGDIVEIIETRPFSKMKSWKLIRVIKNNSRSW